MDDEGNMEMKIHTDVHYDNPISGRLIQSSTSARLSKLWIANVTRVSQVRGS